MENNSGIHKAKLNLNYFFCYNETAQDKELSAQAKGVHMYLLSLPEGWKIYVRELQDHFTNGRDAIIKAFNELIEKEYVIKTEIREGGTFKENLYKVYPVKYSRALELGILADESQQPEEKKEKIPFAEIIDHLNNRTGKAFKSTVEGNKKWIRARWNEGNRKDDFIRVIDNMTSHWLGNEKMEMYLRPSTLFGTEFESYLNRKPKGGGKQLTFSQPAPESQELTEEDREEIRQIKEKIKNM